jgi:hypothetical protein
MKKQTNQLKQSPIKFFVYALAFRFSSGKGRCFSPGFKAMSVHYYETVTLKLINRDAVKHTLFKLGVF